MAERPLYTLYKNLKAQNYDVPDDYNKFESALTRDGKGGADNRHAIYENLKAQNFDVPNTYERFYSALFEPRSKTSSRAKGGSVPMSAADRARFSAGAAAISASARQTMNNAGRYNRLKQRKQKQQKDFGRVNLGTHQTPYGGDANNVVKDDFAYNPETGKAGAYVTSDNENVYSLPEAEQMQAILDKQNDAYQVAVDTGEIPSAFDVRDKNGNYDLQENIGKNGTYLTEEGAQKQFDKKLADAYARKKEIEALIAEDNRQHGNPLLSYGASIGAGNGRTAEQSDYRNKLATSLSLVTEQIGALEAVKQYPTSSWGEDALKALDNTAFTAKTWDFGLTDFAIMGQMERIKTKMDNNIPLSGSDKMLLKSKLGADAATALEDDKMGNVYRWTKIAGQSLPFMADFFLTGGYGGITKGISRGALKFAAKRGMGKVSAAILKNTGIVAGDVIGSYAMAGTEQALKTGADIMQRHLGNLYQDEKGDYKFGTFDENGNLLHEGGESIGTALYKGMTSAMVENYTEKLFGHNYGIKKGAVNFMEKHGMNASAEFFKNIGKSGWYTNSKKWMEKFGINGFAEEVMEEEIGIPLHALLDGEGKVSDILDARQQLDIIGGMAISVGSMYAMGAGSRPVKGIYNRAQYYRFRNKVNVADIDAQNLMGDNWADIKDKIDNATNEQMGGVLADILRQRDTMTKEQINAAVNYGINLMKMRGYNIAKTAEMNAKEITNEPTTPEEQHQADIDNAYSEGHDADDADKHDIQIQQEDQMKTLAAALGISEQQLSAMSDEELESMTGQDDKLDQTIYDYQLSSARYQGVVDDAQDKVDLAAHQAEQRVDMYTDQSRGSVRNATIKASGGLEEYGVYIISGNIATHDDGSIDVGNSDDMILYFDPTTNSVEHADALMFAELGEELPADDVKAQAVAYAKENAIKEVAGIIDGTVEVGSQFNVTDTDGTEHTYEVLADYGDGTAAISIDGNVVENPYSLADLQQMKDLEDQKRLEAAKAEREQMEKEREAQQNQNTEETQPAFDFNQILNDNGNVVLVDVLDKDGNTKYPDSRLFLIRDTGAKAKVVELKSDGTIVPHAVNKEDVATISSMSLDEYKQAMPESSMIEDNSGEESDEDSQLANLGLPKGSEIWMSGDGFGRPKGNTLSRVVGIDEQGSIILEDKDGKKWSASFDYINNHRELPPLDENANIVNEENNQSKSNADENTPAPEQTPAMTLEYGTIVPMLEDGNPDFSKLTAAQTAELYDTQFGEDADSIVSGYVSDAKKALDKASNMTVKGKTFVEQKAAKDAKEKAIADAQAAYDSAIAIRDAYNERQLAKVEDTAEGRKELIEKARRKFARLKSAVKDDAEAVSQLYRDTIGSLLHRLYDGTGIDVTDTIPLTAEEYVASNLGAHSLNYEGTETSKGVKQETGLSREDFAKTQLLAADGKGTTIDALVHSLWENRPSNLESLDTQDIRNALIGILNSGFKASEARNFVENIRIAQAENILEEQKRAQENAAYAEQHKAEQEAELQAKSDEKAELKAKSEEKTHSDAFNKIVDLAKNLEEILDNPDNVKEIDKITHEIDELLETLSDEEFKEVSDVLLNIDEDLDYLTADEYERRERVEESKKAKAYNESLQQSIKRIAPYVDALKTAVNSGDKKAIAKAQKELADALLASNLGHGYLSGQLEYAKSAKKKDESYSERRALVKPLTDAINAIESALDSALAEAGLEGVHVDFKEGGHGWIYADNGSAWSARLKALDNDYRNVSQYETQNPLSVLPQVTIDNVAKVAGIIKSRIEEGERYNSDEYNDEENEKINEQTNENINAPEVPEDATDEAPLGAQRDESDLPFSAKENGNQQTTAERAADVEKNKVDDMKVVDNIVGEKTRKAFERLAKMMGANIQWQYSDKLGNGWIQETTDADGNVHRTIFITLDSSITEGAQFIFGHEMTHQIKNLNPAAYNELTQLVLNTYGSDAFDKAVDETMKRYSDAGFSGRAREYYAEEVVADAVGEMIRDLNLAHTLAMKMSHPLLAAIHEILQKIKLAFFGTEYSDVTKNIIRSIEQAYVKTAKGEVTNSETGEDVSFSLRQKPEPKKKGVGYKVFVLKDGKLYPPMVANPDGAATPVGVWLDADAAPIAGESKTGRPQVKQGGKGTQGGSGKLAYRPGWHLGVVPYAIQFNRKDAEGNKTLFPKNFVFAEVEYAADVDYQEEARQEGINPSGKYQHSLAGLKHLPTDGYYMYRTNPNPETDPWVITGAMKVNRILTRAEQAELVKNAGREPQLIQEGDIVTDDVVNSINQEIADAPKFSLKVYHGSGADFTEFDFDHMGEGAGSQVFGWGGYVTSSKKIGKSYANLVDANAPHQDVEYVGNNAHEYTDVVAGLFNGGQRDYDDVKEFLQNGYNSDKDNARKKQMLEWFESTKPSDWKSVNDGKRNLYEVNIPEDNGSNYLEWEKTLTEKQINAIRDALAKNGVDISSFEKRGFKLDLPFKDVYAAVLPTMMHYKPKDVSKFLSSLGFTGIKYPAGTIMGGAEENDTNYVIFKPEDMKITQHTKFSLKSKPVRFETGKKLSDEEKKEVLSTLKDAYKVNGVPYHIEETAGGKEKRVYEPTADSYVVSDITNRPLRYYITLPDGRVAHPTEVYPNISDNEVKSSATKQGLLDDEADHIVSAAIGNMKGIADNAKVLEVLTEMQNLPHETHDVGYGMNNAQSYNYKTGIFTSDAAQAIDYVVRRMRRKEDVPTEIPAALKKAVADSYGMVDNLIGGMSTTKFSLKKVNDDFNQRLEELVKNPNQKDKILRLGRSSSFLKVGGITDAEIELDFDKFISKSGDKYKNNHPFAASDLINLPMALAEPIAVFNSTTANDHVVLTELQKDGKNFIVAVRAVEQHRKGGVVLEVNKITSLYPKEERGIVYWINNGRISNVDKEKALHFIEALQPHAGTTITDEELKSAANIINSFETTKGNGEKVDVEAPKTFDEFLNHPSLKFSIKNEQQRKAAEDAYEYAFKLRPNKSSQYALVDMSNPSNSPQYYEKKVLADRWRRFYNKAVHNELDDVYKDAWGNYKLFDLDRPFADQVNEVKGDVPSEFNAPDVVANKNADNESGAEYHEYKQDEPSSITYKDRYKAFKQREANREKTAGLRKERKEVEDVYKSKSEERVEYNKQLMKEYMDEHGLSSENDIPYDVWDNLRSKSFEKYQDELDSLFNKYKDLDKQIEAVAEPRFSLKDEKIKSVAEKFGVNEDDVAMYANAVEKGSTAEAARARANIKRYLLQANEDKISSFKELMKYTVPVNESLKENFGDLDAMIEERRKQVEAERNAMEAARKRAQEEEEKRQKHLDELSLIPTDELDKRYMDAIANNDESTEREMLDESARRKGYGDVDSDYQGQGAWAAPSNPQYESDEARRADIENSPDVNLEDIALGYSLQPDDYFDNPRAYMNNTAYGLESAHVIKNALDAIKNGEKDVKVKVYRAVPTSVKEGKLRNGDWVTPSKKYAEMHGDNRLEGKYRIIEDEVPANQLWWDGNDANEFGFDDGKEYRYKNAKNNRKLNDLITYDNKGNVIPPSKRFNSRKNDIRFSLAGERGAADMAEDLKSLNTPDEVDDAIKAAIEDMPSGWKMANKKMIHIAQALGENRKAEIAGEEPKFSLKDGTLIKAGTYFSGGGLVEEGLKGIIDPVVAVEYDEKISGVYRNNFGQHIVTADVRDVDPKELVKQIDGEVEYFHASPVCKNYSQAKSNHAEVELDKETAASTAEFINAVKPKVVTIENVKGYKDSDAMKIITDALGANGYTWDADVYNAADYGGYTNRERLIVRAVRDGKLPAKPEKMARKSGWYEAVADIIPTLTEKKNGVAPWMDIRLKADGIDWRNIDKPLYVMGSAYADGKVPHAFADELLPTLRTKSGDVIVMPDGKVYRAMGRVLARVSGVSDDYKMPFSENLSHIIIGNGIPTQLTEHVIAPLLTGSDPKFSIRTYHGTGASFDKFDLSHALEGEGSESFGHGVYVTNSRKIGREYAQRAKQRKMADLYKNMRYPDGVKDDIFKRRVFGEMVNDVATGGSVASAKDFAKKRVGADANDIQRTLENLKDREKGTEYEQNLKDRLAEYKEGLKWIDSLDEDYLTQGNANRYDVDIPDDNGSNYLDWDAPLTDKQKNTIIKELRRLKIDFVDFKKRGFSFDGSFGGNAYDFLMYALRKTKKWKDVNASRAVSKFLSSIGFTGIKYKAGTIFGGAKEGDYNYVIFDENNANIVGNTRFSLRYDKFEHDLNQWKKDNNLPKDSQRPTIPQRNTGESAVDFLRRVDEYRKQMALWKTAPTYEQHLLSDDTALGEFNRELQRGSVLKRIAFQDSMLAIRKAQEAIMNEVGVDRLNMAEDAYTAENRSHGKGKNEFEEYNNEFLQPLRKAYHQMKKILGDSYDNVRIYMMAKHGLERDAQMAFKKSLDADYEDVAQRSAAYKAYKGDMNRIINDSDLEFGRVDFTTWRQRDNALRAKYSPSYMDYRYDKNGIAYDYSGLSALFDGSDFEESAYKLVKDIEDKYVTETHNLWDATNAATKKILRDGYKAGMMSKDTYQYVRDMYSHYIPLRGWDGTTADQVWDYVGGGKGAFNQTLKTAHGRTSIADDPIAYIENMAESGILLNNKNWVKQHLMLLAQNHPTSLLTLSKAWYVKSTDANGNEEWIPATPQITSQMNSNQVKAAIDAFEKKMEQMAQTGDATQKRDGLNIAYPQTHSEEREHEVRVMKDGEEYVIYVNGDPQLAQAMNNTRAQRVRDIQSGKLDRAAAWLGRKMAAAYTSLSPLFIPSNYFRDLTMTLASTAIREDAKYNYLLRKNLATSWNLGFMLRDFQNGKLRDKVNNGNATPKEQMFYDFMMNGGETGFVSSLEVEDLKKKFKNDLKDLDRWKANPVKVGHTIMDSIEFLNRAIEDSNRFAVYMTSIQYGRSIDEAVNDAKDVTLNFNRKGTGEYGWQMIRNLYLFINPAVQSLQTLGALAKHHPFKFTAVTASWLASGVLVPIVNAALMSLFGGDDDKDKYWQFSKWDRRNNFIMWVPTTNEFVKIPLAQEFRAFYGLGDMIASKMMGGELAEESWSQYAEDLLGQVVDMLPLDPTGYDGNIAVSLMPNAIRPVFELAFNVDFTGKPLFKDTEYNKYDPNFTKAYVGTPDWLVRASRMMNSIGNDYPDVQQNSIDAFGDPRYNLNNPAVVDHVLSSYLGGAYTMGSQVLGLLTKSLNDPKEIKVADIPLFSKFVSNPDDRPVTKKQGDEFWNMKENHDRAANILSKLKKQAKVDGDYSMLERFYGSEEYKQYKQDDVKVKKYEEDKKKERAEESGEEYRPHKLNAEDIYKAHATPKDDFEDLKLKQLYTKLNGFKTSYDLLVDTAPSQSDGYYNNNKAAIDAIDEISLDKQEISELKKGFLDDGKDAYNAEDMKQIRDLRKKILAVLEKANKVVVANQKAKAEK